MEMRFSFYLLLLSYFFGTTVAAKIQVTSLAQFDELITPELGDEKDTIISLHLSDCEGPPSLSDEVVASYESRYGENTFKFAESSDSAVIDALIARYASDNFDPTKKCDIVAHILPGATPDRDISAYELKGGFSSVAKLTHWLFQRWNTRVSFDNRLHEKVSIFWVHRTSGQEVSTVEIRPRQGEGIFSYLGDRFVARLTADGSYIHEYRIATRNDQLFLTPLASQCQLHTSTNTSSSAPSSASAHCLDSTDTSAGAGACSAALDDEPLRLVGLGESLGHGPKSYRPSTICSTGGGGPWGQYIMEVGASGGASGGTGGAGGAGLGLGLSLGLGSDDEEDEEGEEGGDDMDNEDRDDRGSGKSLEEIRRIIASKKDLDDVEYGRELGHKDRQRMMKYYPGRVDKFTPVGFEKIRAPEELYKAMLRYYHAHRLEERIEPWPATDIHVNHWKVNPTMIYLPDRLRPMFFEMLKPTVEAWSGVKGLEPTSLYGIRLYHNGSVLENHVDRPSTHVISAILNIDQDIEEPWPLYIKDHAGTAYNVTMVPGDLVLYESAVCVHGRPTAFKGNYFANAFFHYKPPGWKV